MVVFALALTLTLGSIVDMLVISATIFCAVFRESCGSIRPVVVQTGLLTF